MIYKKQDKVLVHVPDCPGSGAYSFKGIITNIKKCFYEDDLYIITVKGPKDYHASFETDNKSIILGLEKI